MNQKAAATQYDICVDFDGTCVTHEFPRVGREIGAAPILKKLVDAGHRLILFTMRSDRPETNGNVPSDIQDVSGNFLQDAIDWFAKHEIPLYGIQTNPTQNTWTTSPKAYGQLYIDDAALGCPLMYISDISNRPFVDWEEVERILIAQNLI